MIKCVKKIKVIAAGLALGMFLMPFAKVSALEENNKKNDKAPKVVSVSQIADDTLEVAYDKKVDSKKASMPENYWIQSTTDEKPAPIATLGKSEKPGKENSLKKENVIITCKDSSDKIYLLKFKGKIPSKMKYKVLICSITEPGQENYSGENGVVDLTSK